MNILVTGANGQLGRELRIVSADSSDRYYFSDVSQAEGLETVSLDITDSRSVCDFTRAHNIDVIINAAAYTDVEKAEDNAGLAERLNADGPAVLAAAMKERGGLLVHISTDYVFGKEPYNTPCTEDMKGTPTGVYGLSKLHGEERVISSGCRSVIIRTSWLYSEFGRNFCKTIINRTASGGTLKVVFDQAGTPTYALDLANVIVGILKNPVEGIYNYANEGVCSWYDFAKAIADEWGAGECEIVPCHSGEFPSRVTRPSYSVLDKTRIKNTYGFIIPHWTDSLRRCIENIRKWN